MRRSAAPSRALFRVLVGALVSSGELWKGSGEELWKGSGVELWKGSGEEQPSSSSSSSSSPCAPGRAPLPLNGEPS